jgi:hypothetical protein
MKSKYKIITVDGRDYVSASDAKKILGVSSTKELRSLGCATVTIGSGKPLWSLNWIASRATHQLATDSLHPDVEWIKAYESNWVASDSKPRKKLIATRATSDNTLTTSARLKELVKLMPPPDQVPNKNVNWHAVEKLIGAEYPKSFKDFVDVYGALQWFDWLQPLAPFENKPPEHFYEFLNGVFNENFGGEVVDANDELLFAPKFGTPGGWLPFMTGSDGDAYAWLTEGSPNNWNVICVLNRRVNVLPPISIVEMFVGWLNGEPPMQTIWGSVDEFRKHSPKRVPPT